MRYVSKLQQLFAACTVAVVGASPDTRRLVAARLHTCSRPNTEGGCLELTLAIPPFKAFRAFPPWQRLSNL